MRIEVNDEVKKELDRIKAENYIFGKGHSDTITFLIQYYNSHKKIEEIIKDLSKVESLLRKDIKIEKEAPASITKIEGRVFTVVDAKLLVKDSSLAEISKHPIPKGKPDEKRR